MRTGADILGTYAHRAKSVTFATGERHPTEIAAMRGKRFGTAPKRNAARLGLLDVSRTSLVVTNCVHASCARTNSSFNRSSN